MPSYAVELLHLRLSSISEDGKEKWRLAAALSYLKCLIPKRQGRGNRVVTSHRLQISSATRRATTVQD
jgi:hypothetical protein